MPRPALKRASWWPEERIAWQPPEDLTVSECADRYRVLSPKSEKRGQWETSFNPVARAYMDSFGYDCIQRIALVKPTQSSGTEGVLNMLLYAIIQDPGPAMIVEPTETLADEIMTDRIGDMIRYCDRLQAMVSENREETGKKKKTFSSMTTYSAWAGSPTSLASRAIRYCFFDEPDKYPPFSGKEASPLALGEERTNTFRYTKKIVYVCTPTVETGYIAKQERGSEARFRYKIACPHCGHKQQLTLEQVRFGDDHTPAVVEATAWYECAACQGEIHEDRRMELVRRGDWYELTSGLSFAEHVEKHRPKSVGFQFNRLYTPWFTFGAVAAEFLRSKDDRTLFMNFKNSWLAEPWVERVETKTEFELLNRRNDLPALVCPDNTWAVTLGGDPGQKGLWWLALAVLRPLGFHILGYGKLDFVGMGKTPEQRAQLLRSLVFDTRYLALSGRYEYPIWRAGVDTGGGKDGEDETQTARAYQLIRAATDGRRLFGTKGQPTIASGAAVARRDVDKMPGKQGKVIPGGLTVWNINTDAIKSAISHALGLPPGTHGAMSINRDADNLLIRHLMSEERQRDAKTGKWSWVQTGENHLLDCLVGAMAMADRECWGGVDVLKRPQCVPVAQLAPPPAPEAAEVAPPPPVVVPKPQVPRQGWFRRGRRVYSRGIE